MMCTLDQSFYARARHTLCRIAESLEHQAGSELDMDEEPERVTVQCGQGVYLINIHDTAQQIWVSSPLSGAHHFTSAPSCQEWLSTKNTSLTLQDLVSQEFSQLLGHSVVIDHG